MKKGARFWRVEAEYGVEKVKEEEKGGRQISGQAKMGFRIQSLYEVKKG